MVGVGFTFTEMYTMPVYMRNLFLRLAIKRQEDEKASSEKAQKASESPSSKADVKVPGFVKSAVGR
jgi:hypothetical protein